MYRTDTIVDTIAALDRAVAGPVSRGGWGARFRGARAAVRSPDARLRAAQAARRPARWLSGLFLRLALSGIAPVTSGRPHRRGDRAEQPDLRRVVPTKPAPGLPPH